MTTKYVLPNMEEKLSVQVVGKESGINWVGEFVYRRPTLGERSSIDVMRARLNGDLRTLDPDVIAFNEAVSHLRYTLKKYPDWWAESNFGMNLYDSNVVMHIYELAAIFDANWRKKTFGDAAAIDGAQDGATVSAP